MRREWLCGAVRPQTRVSTEFQANELCLIAPSPDERRLVATKRSYRVEFKRTSGRIHISVTRNWYSTSISNNDGKDNYDQYRGQFIRNLAH